MRSQAFTHKGVTLIEVIFSIGVVLIGLLGLLSIMPLAGRRSQEAISLANAAAMGDSVMNELLSRRFISSGLLATLESSPRVLAYNSSVTGGTPPFPRLTIASTPFVGGVCIDPLYKGRNITASSPGNHYDDSLFPYYVNNHDALTDPAASSSAVWPGTNPQARLTRVGFTVVSGTTAEQRLEQSRTFVESPDDLAVTRDNDRSVAASLQGLNASGLSYGRRVPSGEFSWLATISPLQGNRFASVSVVIVRQRVSERDFPTTSGGATKPDDNGASERLAYVTQESGFSGGAGGTVRIAASALTLSRLRSNDWIMLSRRVDIGSVNEAHVHRWYRVASVDAEPTLIIPNGSSTTADTVLQCFLPNTVGTEVWVRDVTLDGPDWDFGLANDGAGEFGDNTFATILSDVVSVTERVVRLSDL